MPPQRWRKNCRPPAYRRSQKINIEILTAPNNSDLRAFGFGSLSTCQRVRDSITKMGHKVRLVHCQSEQDLESTVKRGPDLVVLAVKYLALEESDDIWLSSYFGHCGVNYTGSERDVLELDSNKMLAKSLLQKKGIASANGFIAFPGQYTCEDELPLPFPLFLKPLKAANSNGVDDLSLVTSFLAFQKKLQSISDRYCGPVLVEEYLDGREYTVSVIEGPYGTFTGYPIEVIPPLSEKGLRILGEKAKRDNLETLKKIETNDTGKRLCELAINAFIGLGARDFGRIDIKADKQGQYYFMEANLAPGMNVGTSYFPRACEIEDGLAYDSVVTLMLQKGLSRIAVDRSAVDERRPPTLRVSANGAGIAVHG